MAEIINIDGQPALFLDLVPNWNDEVTMSFAYKTDVFTSYSGKEQRRALRQTARRELNYSALVARDRMRHVNDIMSSWRGGLFLVANPTRVLSTRGALLPGTFVAIIPAAPFWLVEGALVALEHKRRMAYRIVKEVRGYEIEFLNSDGETWPIGTKIRPLLFGRLSSGMKQRVYTDSVASLSLDFSVDPTSEAERYGNQAVVFDDMEILDREPNWREPIDLSFEAVVERLDFDRGRIRVFTPQDFSSRVQRNTYLNRSAEDADYIETFFYRQRGQRGTFLTPTWTEDITLADGTALLAGASTLVTQQTELLQLLSDSVSHRRILVRTKAGDWYPNYIVGMGSVQAGYGFGWGLNWGGPGEQSEALISLRDPWPTTVQDEEIDTISWLLPSRFASDSLTISWHTDSVSEFQINTKTLVDYPYVPSTRSGWGLNYGRRYGGAA